MIPEEMQRTIQFLLDNQAAHDARLAEIEVAIKKLTDSQQATHAEMRTMQNEFREGLQKILTVSERTMEAVRQVAEAEARTINRVGVLEDRVDALENSGK